MEWTQVDAETLIREDHSARSIRSYLDSMDRAAFYESEKSVTGVLGGLPRTPRQG